MSGNSAMAEDVTQEVFITLIRDAGRFDPERGTLGGFLYGIARNHLRRRWEQDRNSVPLPETPDEIDVIVASGPGPQNSLGGNVTSFPAPRDEFAREMRGARAPSDRHAAGKLQGSRRALRTR